MQLDLPRDQRLNNHIADNLYSAPVYSQPAQSSSEVSPVMASSQVAPYRMYIELWKAISVSRSLATHLLVPQLC